MDGQPDFRFPKSARLLTSREFRLVSSRGRRWSSGPFTLLVHATTGQAPSRLGITVSRKVGNAVVRSRVKRIVRECFRLRRPGLTPGLECVIIAKPEAGQTANAELTHALNALFVRAGTSI